MPRINYDRIPYVEKRSTGEHVESNAFYMPKIKEPEWYPGYETVDYFALGFVHDYFKEENYG